MIIQCPKCLAKFKLDDSKVKDEGTKVRCAKCKEVFVVTKEAAAPPPPPPPPEMPAEKEEFDFSFGTSTEEKEEAPFGFGGGFREEEVKKEEESGFSFGGLETGEPKEESKGAVLDWGGMSYGEVSIPGSEEVAPKAEEAPFGGFEFKEATDFEALKEEAPSAPAAPAPPLPSVEEKVSFREELPGTGVSAEEKSLEDFEQEMFPAEAGKAKKGPLLKTVAVVILVCAVIAVPLWYLWKNYKSAETGEITLAELNGSYAQNAEAGNIFVITGKAINNTNKARSFFQVKGILYDKKGERLAQSEAYCGNIFSTKEIATLPRAKIETDLKNKVGSSLSNINLASGKAVLFMIVFFDLPAEMGEFSAEVTGSQVASE